MEQTKALNVYLANLAVWNVKLHNIHWNVQGPFFAAIHAYTEKLYDQVFEAYDEVAEILKMRGEMPLATMKSYLEVATMKETEARVYPCCEANAIVEADIQFMLEQATAIRNAAAKADDFQVQGTFEGFIDGFKKELWFLRSMKRTDKECSL